MPITITFQVSGWVGEEEVKLTGRFDVPDELALPFVQNTVNKVTTRPIAEEFADGGSDERALDEEASQAARRKPGTMRTVVALKYKLSDDKMEFWNEGRRFAETTIGSKAPVWKSWVTPRLAKLTSDWKMRDLPAPVQLTLVVSERKNTAGNYYEDVVKIEAVKS